MADQILATTHFYLNGSMYNSSDIDKPAEIHVQDTSDIIVRSDNYMVHVTRFSVDTMRSLVFVNGKSQLYRSAEHPRTFLRSRWTETTARPTIS